MIGKVAWVLSLGWLAVVGVVWAVLVAVGWVDEDDDEGMWQ